jgi:ABC-type transport system involved in multi-copper enzyme maturation permease subunit
MKYFAILKDSLREVWDSWVLLILLILSALVSLFVATLSYTPLPARETMQNMVSTNLYWRLTGPFGPRHGRVGFTHNFQLDDVTQKAGDTDSPRGEYELKIGAQPHKFVQHFPENGPGKPAKQPRTDLDPRAGIEDLRKLFGQLEKMGFIEIVSIQPAGFDERQQNLRYVVTLKGTSKTHRIWATEISLLFGALPVTHQALGVALFELSGGIIVLSSWIGVFMGVLITASFIPTMLRKGTVDLLLVKPLSRWALLFYKFLGGLLFVLLTTGVAIGGMWLAVGIRSGLWPNGIFVLIFPITFFFAILYSISTLVSVLTRSVVASILVTLGVWLGLFVLGQLYENFVERAEAQREAIQQMEENERQMDEKERQMHEKERQMHEKERRRQPMAEEGTFTKTVSALYTITPHTSDLTMLNFLIIGTEFLSGNIADMGEFDNTKRNWWGSLLVSTVWIAIFLGLAILRFCYKDY